jgi:hypothetical protein
LDASFRALEELPMPLRQTRKTRKPYQPPVLISISAEQAMSLLRKAAVSPAALQAERDIPARVMSTRRRQSRGRNTV